MSGGNAAPTPLRGLGTRSAIPAPLPLPSLTLSSRSLYKTIKMGAQTSRSRGFFHLAAFRKDFYSGIQHQYFLESILGILARWRWLCPFGGCNRYWKSRRIYCQRLCIQTGVGTFSVLRKVILVSHQGMAVLWTPNLTRPGYSSSQTQHLEARNTPRLFHLKFINW
jgi:hypothetical protein